MMMTNKNVLLVLAAVAAWVVLTVTLKGVKLEPDVSYVKWDTPDGKAPPLPPMRETIPDHLLAKYERQFCVNVGFRTSCPEWVKKVYPGIGE
jgi:hypothetical protein